MYDILCLYIYIDINMYSHKSKYFIKCINSNLGFIYRSLHVFVSLMQLSYMMGEMSEKSTWLLRNTEQTKEN
jgi:hypothetical protein